jgi:hypothetical protein
MSDKVSNKSIPGPIEVTDEVRSSILGDKIAIGLHRSILIITSQVLYANAHPSVSHMSANFTAIFGESIRMTRYVRIIQTCSPFNPTLNASFMCISNQRGCPDDNRTTVSYFRIWDTWMGSGKPFTSLPLRYHAPGPPKIQMLGFSQPRRAWRKGFGTQRWIFRRWPSRLVRI